MHHLCLFHAPQDVQQHIKTVYGPDYAEQYPEAEDLKQQINTIFAATTLALATQRYAAALALRPDYVQARPEAVAIFDFLERHWPKLVNYLDASHIPATNNAVDSGGAIGRGIIASSHPATPLFSR